MAAMGKLRNWQHEKFAEQIAAGTDPREAYTISGYERNRANHNKLLRRSDVAWRIEELKQQREDAARAAGMSPAAVLAVLRGFCIERVEDFFDRDEAGIVRVRDHQQIPVEASIALLRFLREGLGIKNGAP
jgi:hypothetical protein